VKIRKGLARQRLPIGPCLGRKVNPRDYLDWHFAKLPTVSAPNAGHFTLAAEALFSPPNSYFLHLFLTPPPT